MENIGFSKKMQKYMHEIATDTEISEINIKEKTFLRASLCAKWGRYSFEENQYTKLLKQNIEKLREEIKKKLYEKQKISIENADINRQRLINMDAEKILIKSSQYQQYKKELDEQEDIIRLIEESKQIISQMGFDLKNAIEVLKLESI